MSATGYAYAKRLRYYALKTCQTSSDRTKPLEERIQTFLQLGSVVGILIDPDKLILTVYRLNQAPVILFQNGDTLTLLDLLPDWELAVSELWPPKFE